MTIGVGGSNAAEELEKLSDRTHGARPIGVAEHRQRIDNVRELMAAQGIDALFLAAGANLVYFTGMRWGLSERLAGVLIPAEGPLGYVAPGFERDTFKGFMQMEGELRTWEEHENPFALVGTMLDAAGAGRGVVALDADMPFAFVDGLRDARPDCRFVNAAAITSPCRSRKSAAEIALMQCAKDLTLEVHRAAAAILRPGITTTEVTDFIDRAHRAAGASSGSAFCIVLFGVATSFPHGVKEPQVLGKDDWVLIDTGCRVHGYHSDITRSYAFGEPTPRQRDAWAVEHEAQAAAFGAARLGAPCESVDAAARWVLESHGFGPGYALPGLPHRTGHGCGLQVHETPYLVRGDETPLDVGMAASNEPMLVLPGEFGVRLEDHFYMADDGARWFTRPSPAVDDPFGLS